MRPWRSCKHARERSRRGRCAECGITNWSRWRRWAAWWRAFGPPFLIAATLAAAVGFTVLLIRHLAKHGGHLR